MGFFWYSTRHFSHKVGEIPIIDIFSTCGVWTTHPKTKAQNLPPPRAGYGTKPCPRAGMVSRAKVRGRANGKREQKEGGGGGGREGERVSAKES